MANSRLPSTAQPPRLSLSEELTLQFYDWETRGRGWWVWSHPVDLEPPFRPFYRYLPQRPVKDDGREHSFWSRIGEWFGQRSAFVPDPPDEPIEEPWPAPSDFDGANIQLVEFLITLPPGYEVSRALSEQFLLNLGAMSGPVSFEVVGTGDAIRVSLVVRERDAPNTRGLLQAHFPEAVIDVMASDSWSQVRYEGLSVIVDFGLNHEFCRPLRTASRFDPDPLIGCVAALEDIDRGEMAMLQVLFQPVRHAWAESVFRAVTNADGKSFFADAPDITRQAREKLDSPLFAATVRIAANCRSEERSWQRVRSIASFFRQLEDPNSNALVPLSEDDYPFIHRVFDLRNRTSCRSGMLLNAAELVSLVHLPSASVKSLKLVRLIKKSQPAPDTATEHELVLGENCHQGEVREVGLSVPQRTQHMHLIGASGTGKSTLLLNMAIQDMAAGHGFAVLDPHGDLIDDIIARVPTDRLKDVILFDPADAEYPIGCNLLSAHSELEKNLLASDLVSVFRRLSTSWGDQMTTVLANAVLAFLESEEGGTLADLRRFLVEKSFRQRFLRSVKDPEIVYYWQKEFPLLTGKPQGPILTRLDAFLRPKLIRHMVCQKDTRLNFADIMDNGKILLAKLAQGAIGEENSYLLGSFLVSKFQQLALARQEQQAMTRRPFFLYVDEFHNFVCPSLAPLLTGARKYRLGLVLAHQELRQLEKRDAEVASAVLTNPYTRICFRVGDVDARKLSESFGHFEGSDLMNLGVGEAICRVERMEWDFNLKTRSAPEVDAVDAQITLRRIRECTRERYATPRGTVERMLQEQWSAEKSEDPLADTAPITKIAKQKPATPEPDPEPLIGAAGTADESISEEASKPKKTAASGISGIMGKGGREHRYLQNFIKRWAEGMGYRATIEKPLDDRESVDVVLEKDEFSIACEIAVTTTPDHELNNLRKCLVAGFSHIAVVSNDPKKLKEIEKRSIGAFSPGELACAGFYSPEELIRFIENREAETATREHTVKGYKVRVKYGSPGEQEKKARKRGVSQTILGALSKRRKGG